MTNKLKTIVKSFLPQKHFQRFYLGCYYLGIWGMNYGNGANTRTSGEVQAIKHIKSCLSKKKSTITLFDVGANSGEYTLLLNETFSGAQVHVFEPLQSMCEIIEKKIKNASGSNELFVYQSAIGDQIGEVPIYTNPKETSLSSLVEYRDIGDSIETKIVPITTIDEFIKTKDIEEIDFLKIDVEGYELNVLKGAEKSIAENRIHFIQFEFGGTMVDSKTFFKDFYKLLDPNFKIFRILKNGIYPIQQYHSHHEIFHFSNFIAKRK